MDDVKKLMDMTFCSEEQARDALSQTNNLVDAMCLILDVKPVLPPKQKPMTEEQLWFKEVRTSMEKMDKNIEDGLKKKDQLESSCQDLKDIPTLQQQSSPHSDPTRQSHLEVQAEEEQKQEIAYQ